MTITSIFPIPSRNFAGGPEFREYLASHLASPQFHRPLTMLVGLSKRTSDDLPAALASFGLEVVGRSGSVLRIRSSRESAKLEAYVTQEDDGVLVFYTDFRKTEDIPILNEFLAKDKRTRPLRLRSLVIQRTLDHLLELDSDLRVTRFTAKGYAGSVKKAPIRPGRTRTFAYWGEDGREVLDELRRQYGVSPTSLELDLSRRARIIIDDRGMLTHKRGDLSLVFDSLRTALEEARANLAAIDKARFEVVNPLKNRSATFEIARSEPAVIRLRNKFTFPAAEAFFGEVLTEKEYGKLSLLTQEGSLFVSTDLLSPEGSRFRVRADEHEIRILPSGVSDFRAYLSFYELVLEHVDPDAELVG